MVMGEKIIAFFDWREGVSRINYFRGIILRSIVISAVVGLNYILSALFGWDIISDFTEDVPLFMNDPLIVVSSFIIFVPWDLRRMKDAGINWWWIVPFEILLRLPEPPEIEGNEYIGQNAAYLLISIIPAVVFNLILLFKPGRISREFKRNSPVRGGSRPRSSASKVTYSK